MLTRTLLTCLLAAGLTASQFAAAQSVGRGTLLISTSSLADTIFEETVLLIVHHDDDGSIGIMINRPTNLRPADVFPDVVGPRSYTGVLYFGGPVATGRPFVLARGSDSLPQTSMRIADDVYLSGDASALGALDADERSDSFARVYAGSAQWGPGQLQGEIDSGAWEIALGSARTVFSDDSETLWSRVMSAPRGSDIARIRNPAQTAAQTMAMAGD